MMYKIHINDRNYQSWDIYNSDTLEKVDNINVDPIVSKLFTNDIFYSDRTGVHISIRLFAHPVLYRLSQLLTVIRLMDERKEKAVNYIINVFQMILDYQLSQFHMKLNTWVSQKCLKIYM